MNYSPNLLTYNNIVADSYVSSGYEAWRAIDQRLDNRWWANNASPNALMYDFGSGNEKVINVVRIKPDNLRCKDFVISGSNLSSPGILTDLDWTDIYTGQHAENNDFEDFIFPNATAYRHYRLKITSAWLTGYQVQIAELEMMELDLYTDNLLVDGTPSASSEYSPSYSASKAFNGSFLYNDFWRSNSELPAWIKYDLGEGNETIIQRIDITINYTDTALRPTDFLIQASNNNSDWTTLSTISSEVWNVGYLAFTRGYTFENTVAYRYYRIYISGVSSGDSPTICEIQGMAKIENNVIEEEILNINESIKFGTYKTFNEQLNLLENFTIKKAEKVLDSNVLEIQESSEFLAQYNQSEILEILEEIEINQSLEKILSEENILIDEDYDFHGIGLIKLLYNTDFRTKKRVFLLFSTLLYLQHRQSLIYFTNLITKKVKSHIYRTDLRTRVSDYDLLEPKTLDDIIVKLDGVEIKDFDIDSLKIEYKLNSSPSTATMVLARRHDNFNYKMDDSYSQIDNENKIEIYDSNIKLFTGYITNINALSQTDTISIVAEDIRYKLSLQSMELEYGGEYQNPEPQEDEANKEKWIKFEKNIFSALNEVLLEISTIINGYDSLPFSGLYVPAYTKSYNSYDKLLDELITQTANISWYTDANERLRFQKVDNGQIIELNLSNLSGKRRIYDAIVTDVQLNKKKTSYAKSLLVKLGKSYDNKWSRRIFEGYLLDVPEFLRSLKEKTIFCFQQWGESFINKFYVGINKTIYGYANEEGWVLKPIMTIQHQSKKTENDLSDITVGSGVPVKTLYLNSHSKISNNDRWEEKTNPSNDKIYLASINDGNSDETEYAREVAEFDLSQRNKLETSANVSILLDAFEYYNITLSNRINLVNTIGVDIYKNTNGFPLNISSISIDLSQRLVTLNLTNYGKTYYEKTKNWFNQRTAPRVVYLYEKKAVVRMSGL